MGASAPFFLHGWVQVAQGMAENSNMARLHSSVSRLNFTRLQATGWLLTASLALGGCDALGLETPGKVAERKEAEGRAIGSACRHAVRSIEDCYATNPKASKAAIFAGWREMDEYMRENEIPGQPASPPPTPALTGQAPGEEIIAPTAGTASTTASATAAGASSATGAAAPTGAIALPNLPARPTVAPAR